jgi:hypothetical protein
VQETEEGLTKIKNDKSTGENGIPAEILKYIRVKLKRRVRAQIK